MRKIDHILLIFIVSLLFVACGQEFTSSNVSCDDTTVAAPQPTEPVPIQAPVVGTTLSLQALAAQVDRQGYALLSRLPTQQAESLLTVLQANQASGSSVGVNGALISTEQLIALIQQTRGTSFGAPSNGYDDGSGYDDYQ